MPHSRRWTLGLLVHSTGLSDTAKAVFAGGSCCSPPPCAANSSPSFSLPFYTVRSAQGLTSWATALVFKVSWRARREGLEKYK